MPVFMKFQARLDPSPNFGVFGKPFNGCGYELGCQCIRHSSPQIVGERGRFLDQRESRYGLDILCQSKGVTLRLA